MRNEDSHGARHLSALIALAAAILCAPAVRSADYHVPSAPTPTLQDAIDDAVVSGDPQETIYIDANIDVFAETLIPFGFDATHKLLIRPGTTLLRATIRMMACCDPVIHATGTSYVTIQDLDIFRHITNNDHIIYYSLCSNMLIQRCRVGSDWTVPGAANWSAIYWAYPFNSMIRNTLAFATAPSTFQYGISIVSHDDPGSRLWLYNNSLQGIYGGGISLQGAAGKVMLRNNVVVTEDAINPDPVGYVGNIGAGLTLVSSHNGVFCNAGDEWAGADDIRGASFIRRNFADIAASFTAASWVPGSPNPGFLGLNGAGPLHVGAALGVNLPGAAPDPDDQAVLDDWEHEPRPSGLPAHTDRGADQNDAENPASSVEPIAHRPSFDLTVSPVPARGPVEILLRGDDAPGFVTIRLHDSAGRLVRDVWSGEVRAERTIRWDGAGLPAGVYYLSARMGDETRVRKFIRIP